MSAYTASELSSKLISIFVSCSPRYGARQYDGEVCSKVHALVKSIHDGPSGFLSDLNLRWDQGWSLEATLHVKIRTEQKVRLDGPAMILECTTDMSWPSSGRSIAEATVAVALYREIIELAALVEATLHGATLLIDKEGGK